MSALATITVSVFFATPKVIMPAQTSRFPLTMNQRRPKRSEFEPNSMNAIALHMVYTVVHQLALAGLPKIVATVPWIAASVATFQKEIPYDL